MTSSRGFFSSEQVAQLLKPVNPARVLQAQGHSHVSQQDITAHLIRMFGFGNFDIEVLDVSLIFDTQRSDAKTGELLPKFDVCYRAMVRITVRNSAGELVAFYENGSTATAQNQSHGDGHDLAYKSAISLSISVPAPVSPVTTVKPSSISISSCFIIAKLRIVSSRNDITRFQKSALLSATPPKLGP